VQFKQREIVLVRQEPINEAGQAIHAAERFLQLGQNNRAANPEQQAVKPCTRRRRRRSSSSISRRRTEKLSPFAQ
jgi:hypothetical protein